MFFMGILLSVEALNAAGLLQLLATDLNKAVPDVNIIAAVIGLASAVIDNVSSFINRGWFHWWSVQWARCCMRRTKFQS